MTTIGFQGYGMVRGQKPKVIGVSSRFAGVFLRPRSVMEANILSSESFVFGFFSAFDASALYGSALLQQQRVGSCI